MIFSTKTLIFYSIDKYDGEIDQIHKLQARKMEVKSTERQMFVPRKRFDELEYVDSFNIIKVKPIDVRTEFDSLQSLYMLFS